MNHYKNSDGGATPKKFDATALASAGLDLIVGTVFSVQNAKKQRQLQEKIAKLSLEQQKQLEESLLKAQTELGRQRIMYQTLAVVNEQNLVDGRKNKQLILLGILGGGTLLLVAMAIFYKRN